MSAVFLQPSATPALFFFERSADSYPIHSRLRAPPSPVNVFPLHHPTPHYKLSRPSYTSPPPIFISTSDHRPPPAPCLAVMSAKSPPASHPILRTPLFHSSVASSPSQPPQPPPLQPIHPIRRNRPKSPKKRRRKRRGTHLSSSGNHCTVKLGHVNAWVRTRS